MRRRRSCWPASSSQLRGTPILVFATYREPGDGGAGLLPRLSADASTERVDLPGLPAGAVGDMLLAAGLPASPERVGQVHSETGGNPFLIGELARMLAGQRGGGPEALQGLEGPEPVPGRVVEATAYRLAQLPDPARALLRTAAVAGNGFSAGVVAAMLDVPVLALLGPLDECRAAGFLVPGDRPGDHRFSHALVRSAVAAGLSAEDQRRLHAAAADAIEALYQGQERPHLAEVARHRVAASLPGDRARAVAACATVAGVAADELAFEEAVRLYRQALSAGQGEIDDAERSRLELALAMELYHCGDLAGSQQLAVRVGRRAERRRDRLWLARTALVLEASGDPDWDGEICRLCEQALAGDELPDDLRARVSARYAQALVYQGEYDRAGQVSRAALAAAGSAADPVALVDALRARQLACWAHALPVAIGLGRTRDIEFLAARFEPFRGQHIANGAGAGVYMGPVELALGMAAAALGRLDAAVTDLRDAASICAANGARGYAVQARVELAEALTRRLAPGDPGQVADALAAATDEAERLGMTPFTQRISRLRGERPGAAAAPSPLSPRELEVAGLVARGLTNKQTGQALYVSERTAENHVQHILTKLGFGNRSQIAAWASTQAAAGP